MLLSTPLAPMLGALLGSVRSLMLTPGVWSFAQAHAGAGVAAAVGRLTTPASCRRSRRTDLDGADPGRDPNAFAVGEAAAYGTSGG